MKNLGSLLLLVSFFALSCSQKKEAISTATSYYIDPETGRDENAGTSVSAPWKSLQRIASAELRAGDAILLAGGKKHRGSLRLSRLAGTGEKPVSISSYGGSRAVIESGDSLALLAIDCSHIVVRNIEASGSGRLEGNITNGIELLNCKSSTIDSCSAHGFLYSGIRITGGKDIRITNCFSSDNGFCGINVESGENEYGADGSLYKTMRGLYIGHCIADNNPGCPAIKNNHSGNGILIGGVTGGLIEHCEAMNNGWDMPREGNGPVGIWAYMCDSVIIQYCYAHQNKTSPKGKDGGGFDFDGGIRYSVMRYNVSAFNEGAGYGIFQYGGATEWCHNTAHDNISINDGSKNGQCGFLVWTDPTGGPMHSFTAFNNTVVNDKYAVNF
nr:right-handed parallel beta-helix repeat-containing protein [Bacteroidales bacterium]